MFETETLEEKLLYEIFSEQCAEQAKEENRKRETMTNELDKQFFDTFGIEPYIRHWQQYNFAQVENGLKLFPERQKLADEGYIKITCKKLNPTEFNDCVYWEEYHYPQITDSILLELICIHIKYLTFGVLSHNIEKLKNEVLTDLRIKKDVGNIYNEVRTLFEEG